MADEATRSVGPRVLASLVAVILGCYLLVEWIVEDLVGGFTGFGEVAVEGVANAVVSSLLLWLVVIRPWVSRERLITARREGVMRRDAKRQDLDARLHRALEMASSEQRCYDVVERSFRRTAPDLAAELLLADSSEAYLKVAVSNGPGGSGPGCGVDSPEDCPAVRRAQTLVFPSSDEIDACPHLAGRQAGHLSAACVPVSVAGRTIGVLHATSASGVPDAARVEALETIADQAGSRIGLLRVMERTQLQAATDPLTGLLNRRTVENQARTLAQQGKTFAVVMGDLDHFKQVNDRYGHDAGDRALRLFARTLQAGMRAEDLVARFGGEEFVIVLPDLRAEEAATALHRVQEQLAVALAGGTVPGCTVSFGVSDTTDAGSLEDLLRIADEALFEAKRLGRNRVVISHDLGAPPGTDVPSLQVVTALS